jgi:demethylmenaquinone methyltransferase/2-methoxy-6-polyprenyl-1,4-benzoquinol methylase
MTIAAWMRMTRVVTLPRRSTAASDTRTDEERHYYQATADVFDSALASFYDVVAFPLHWLRRRVVRLSEMAPGMRVLDVATGTGSQARAFADAAARVVGVDLSPRMLAIARRKDRGHGVRFIEGDATALPMADQTFDVSCVSLGLHEMPLSVRVRAVHEMARVTREGGTVVVVDHVAPRNRVWRAIVLRAWSLIERDAYPEFIRSDLHALLAQHGIRVRRDYRALLDTIQIVVGTRTWS